MFFTMWYMVCDSVDQYELLALIATLDNSKSPGHDNIGARLIKEVKHYIVEPLLHIINLSLIMVFFLTG